jgi:hypothetical protein
MSISPPLARLAPPEIRRLSLASEPLAGRITAKRRFLTTVATFELEIKQSK